MKGPTVRGHRALVEGSRQPGFLCQHVLGRWDWSTNGRVIVDTLLLSALPCSQDWRYERRTPWSWNRQTLYRQLSPTYFLVEGKMAAKHDHTHRSRHFGTSAELHLSSCQVRPCAHETISHHTTGRRREDERTHLSCLGLAEQHPLTQKSTVAQTRRPLEAGRSGLPLIEAEALALTSSERAIASRQQVQVQADNKAEQRQIDCRR